MSLFGRSGDVKDITLEVITACWEPGRGYVECSPYLRVSVVTQDYDTLSSELPLSELKEALDKLKSS
jgi:hypothetical protein